MFISWRAVLIGDMCWLFLDKRNSVEFERKTPPWKGWDNLGSVRVCAWRDIAAAAGYYGVRFR
jgi:hypothetical protein